MVRLFLAINLPAEIKEKLAALQNELAESRADVRWVRPEGIHLTLKFLGNVSEDRIEEIVAAAQEAIKKASPGVIKLGIKGLGTFPPHKAPRVVWAGLTGDLVPLARLQQALEEALARIGFEKENRPFIPHLTLGRVKSSRRKEALLKKIEKYREEEITPEIIEVSEIVLYQSTLHPKGAIYTPLRRMSLKQ